MIELKDVFPIGNINKPHGINGEMSFTFTSDVFDTENAEYFIFEMDGILVPFYIDSYRFRTDTTALLKLDGVANEEQARAFSHKTVYLPVCFSDKAAEDEPGLEYFTGFSLIDEHAGLLGLIVDVDESTENILFIVEKDSDELLIPANDDFILDINHAEKIMSVRLPEGLVDLQK